MAYVLHSTSLQPTNSQSQEYSDVPTTLPDWLVPESKVHLVQATRALSGQSTSYPSIPSPTSSPPGLKDGFDWYMSPTDISKYTSIYTANTSPSTGALSFSSLDQLYSSLDVPDTDLRSAWNLVNPSSQPAINKHAALAFLHILNQRHEGFRIPRSIPPSLRSSFEENKIDYSVERVKSPAQRWATSEDDRETPTGRKAKFGDTYLSRLGAGGKSSYATKGTDFSGTRSKDAEWEEVRLKKQLVELEDKIASIEAKNKSPSLSSARRDKSKPALVKRELEMLLEYKRKEIRELERGEGRSEVGEKLRGVEGDLASVREMVEGLETHLREREGVLGGLREEVEGVKVGGR